MKFGIRGRSPRRPAHGGKNISNGTTNKGNALLFGDGGIAELLRGRPHKAAGKGAGKGYRKCCDSPMTEITVRACSRGSSTDGGSAKRQLSVSMPVQGNPFEGSPFEDQGWTEELERLDKVEEGHSRQNAPDQRQGQRGVHSNSPGSSSLGSSFNSKGSSSLSTLTQSTRQRPRMSKSTPVGSNPFEDGLADELARLEEEEVNHQKNVSNGVTNTPARQRKPLSNSLGSSFNSKQSSVSTLTQSTTQQKPMMPLLRPPSSKRRSQSPTSSQSPSEGRRRGRPRRMVSFDLESEVKEYAEGELSPRRVSFEEEDEDDLKLEKGGTENDERGHPEAAGSSEEEEDVFGGGLCPEHPYVELRRYDPQNKSWRTMLNSCPVCKAKREAAAEMKARRSKRNENDAVVENCNSDCTVDDDALRKLREEARQQAKELANAHALIDQLKNAVSSFEEENGALRATAMMGPNPNAAGRYFYETLRGLTTEKEELKRENETLRRENEMLGNSNLREVCVPSPRASFVEGEGDDVLDGSPKMTECTEGEPISDLDEDDDAPDGPRYPNFAEGAHGDAFLSPLMEEEDEDAPSPGLNPGCVAMPLEDGPWSSDDSGDEAGAEERQKDGAGKSVSLRKSSLIGFRFTEDGEDLEYLDDSDEDEDHDSDTSITEDDLMEDREQQEDLFESLHSVLSLGNRNRERNDDSKSRLKRSLGLDDLEQSMEDMEFIEDLIAKADKYMSCPDFDTSEEGCLTRHRLAAGYEETRQVSEKDASAVSAVDKKEQAFVPATVKPDSLKRRLRRSSDYARHANSSSISSADSNVSELTSSFTRSAPVLHQHSDVIRLEYERRILRDRLSAVPKFSESWFQLKGELVEVDAYLDEDGGASVRR